MGVILVVAMCAPLKLVALDFQKPRVKAVLTLMVDPSVACAMVGVVPGGSSFMMALAAAFVFFGS
jgi:hypothetical protein